MKRIIITPEIDGLKEYCSSLWRKANSKKRIIRFSYDGNKYISRKSFTLIICDDNLGNKVGHWYLVGVLGLRSK